MKPRKWREEEYGILETLYPRAEKSIILKELKKRSWSDIQEKAESLGLKRLISDAPKPGRRKRKHRVSISKTELATLWVKRDLTIYDIAKRLKTTPDVVRRTVFKYGF